LAWGRPQSAHGLYELLKKQNNSCASCPVSWQQYLSAAITKNSKFYETDIPSRSIELVMRRFKKLIPISIRPEVDHIMAISLGGTALGLNNHQILCAKCHKEKTKKDIKEKFAKNGNPRKGAKLSASHVDSMSKSRNGFDSEARKESRNKNLYPKIRKPVVATNLATQQEFHFESGKECAKALNLQNSNVSRVLTNKQGRKQHKGWTFRYDSDILKTEGDQNEKASIESPGKPGPDSNSDSDV
jgi:hypothetical protein